MISNSYNRFTKGLIAIVLVAVMTYGFTSHAAGLANDYHAGEEVSKNEQIFTVSAELLAAADREVDATQVAALMAEARYLAKKAEEEQRAIEAALRAEAERKAAEEAQRKAAEEAARQASSSNVTWTQEAAVSVDYSEQELLAALIYCEAGNQPYEGQVAVGAVVLNRVRSGSYPNSIREVIYQSGQFGPAGSGWLDRVLSSGGYTDTARQAAADALAGSNPIGGCLYFGCGDYGTKIGDHWFH